MKYMILSDVKCMELLLDIDIDDINIDLHNDFDYTGSITKDNVLELHFKKVVETEKYPETNAVLIFSGIAEQEIKLGIPDTVNSTLMTFARSEMLEANRYYNRDDIRCFFIDFENDLSIEVYCNDVIFILW